MAFHVLLVCTVFHPFGSANDAAFRASWIFGVGCSAFQVGYRQQPAHPHQLPNSRHLVAWPAA